MARIDTPCVRVCRQDPAKGFCTGCGRTVQEIFAWPDMTPERRRELTAELRARLEGKGGNAVRDRNGPNGASGLNRDTKRR